MGVIDWNDPMLEGFDEWLASESTDYFDLYLQKLRDDNPEELVRFVNVVLESAPFGEDLAEDLVGFGKEQKEEGREVPVPELFHNFYNQLEFRDSESIALFAFDNDEAFRTFVLKAFKGEA